MTSFVTLGIIYQQNNSDPSRLFLMSFTERHFTITAIDFWSAKKRFYVEFANIKTAHQNCYLIITETFLFQKLLSDRVLS